jgi:hypothetical protein
MSDTTDENKEERVLFTEDESDELQEVVGFTPSLFKKFMLYVQDQILRSVTFANKVREIASSGLYTAFGVANMQELVVKLTLSQNNVPAEVSTQLESKLRDPGFVKALVSAIAKDPEACKILHASLETCRKEKISAAAERRHANLTKAAINFYKNDGPADVEITADDVTKVVEWMDELGIVRDKNVAEYDEIVPKWIRAKEFAMTMLITELVKAKTSEELVKAYARNLVLRGFNAEKAVVRAELAKEDDIKSALKAK